MPRGEPVPPQAVSPQAMPPRSEPARNEPPPEPPPPPPRTPTATYEAPEKPESKPEPVRPAEPPTRERTKAQPKPPEPPKRTGFRLPFDISKGFSVATLESIKGWLDRLPAAWRIALVALMMVWGMVFFMLIIQFVRGDDGGM